MAFFCDMRVSSFLPDNTIFGILPYDFRKEVINMKKWVLKVFSASAALTLLVTATIPFDCKMHSQVGRGLSVAVWSDDWRDSLRT